jgi:hypothetical protein
MFWSIEVEHGKNKHKPSGLPAFESLPDDGFFNDIEAESDFLQVTPFWHNPLHDCESSWWMSLLYSFAMRIHSEPDSKWDSDAQVDQLNIAFSGRFRTTDRRDLFEEVGPLVEVFQSFGTKLQPARPTVNFIRGTLIKAFERAGARLPAGGIDRSVWEYDKLLHITIKRATARLKAYNWPKMENWSPEKAN